MTANRKILFGFLWTLVCVLIGMELPFSQGGVFSRVFARWADFQRHEVPAQAPEFMSLISEPDLKKLIAAGVTLRSFDFSGFELVSEQKEKNGFVSKLLRKGTEYVYRTEDEKGQVRRLTWGSGEENSISASFAEDGFVESVLMDTEPRSGESRGRMAWLQFKGGEPYSVILPSQPFGTSPVLIFEYLMNPADGVASRFLSGKFIVEYDGRGKMVAKYRLVGGSKEWERYDRSGALVGTGSLDKWMQFKTN